MFEVTFLDSGKTEYWTKRECNSFFGRSEFVEILGGCLPNIVAVRISP